MFWRRRRQSDFSAEIQAHIELEAERLRARGMSDAEAWSAARRAFGNVTGAEERFYESGRALWRDHLRNDLLYSFRLMRKSPALTAVIVLTLALGIGANTVIFSFVHAVVLRPLAFEDPERLVQVWESGLRSSDADWVSFPNFRDWRSQNKVFIQMAAYRYALLTMKADREAESVLSLEVTDRLFDVLGASPALGRTFLPGEDQTGRQAVVVVSHALWLRSFGGDPAILGKSVRIDGNVYTVIGVMSPTFRFPNSIPGDVAIVAVDLWIPMRSGPDLEQRGSHNFWAIARLKPGVEIEEARANMESIGANLARSYPSTNEKIGAVVTKLQDHIIKQVRPAMLLLLAAVGLVLLLACANIAGLLLSRAESRRREMAVRAALGASRARLFAQTLTESVVLSLVGAAGAVGLAYLGRDALVNFGPANIPRFKDAAIDLQVLLFTAAIALVAGVLSGLAPAVFGARSVALSMQEGGTRSTTGPSGLAVRNLLVGGEMALAVVLLIGAGLVIRSFVHLVGLDLGFRPERLVTAYISLPETRYADPSKQRVFFEDVLRRVHGLPGVRSAAVSNSVPLSGMNDQGNFQIEGRPPAPNRQGPFANRPRVSTGYFETMGIQLVQGRLLNDYDRADSLPVVVVSDLAVSTYWPKENPIGKRVSVNSVDGKRIWRQIVGVVRSTRHFGLEAPQKPEIYLPHTQLPTAFMTLVVRGESDRLGLIPAVRREIAAVDPAQAGFGFQSMDESLFHAESRRRFQMILMVAFGALALILAAIGIYGVMAYTVAQRTREIGVRMALGALPRDVVEMLLRKGLLVTVVGMAVGFAGAAALSRVLGSLLFGVTALDGATFAAAGALLGAISSLAVYLPARRAARVDPVIALRDA